MQCIVYTVYMCFPHHAGSTPDICRSAVTSSYQDLNGAVLSRLDVFCKVLVLERRGEGEERVRLYLSNLNSPTLSY